MQAGYFALPAPAEAPRRTSRIAWALAAVFAMATILVAWLHWGPKFSERRTEAPQEVVATNSPQMRLYSRDGRLLGALGGPADYSNPALSPDGKRLAVSIRDVSRTRDIWIFEFKGRGTRFTSDASDETNPVWSPDGSEVVYASDREGRRDLYSRSSTGGPERLLLATEHDKNPLDWARDGSAIYYNEGRTNGDHDVCVLPLKGKDRSPRLFLATPETRDWVALSPDYRWLLYRAGRGATSRTLLRSILPTGREWAIGVTGTMEGHWREDGRQVYFISGDSMMAQDVAVRESEVLLGTPVRLFRAPALSTFGRNAFVVTPDGQRFLILTAP